MSGSVHESSGRNAVENLLSFVEITAGKAVLRLET